MLPSEVRCLLVCTRKVEPRTTYCPRRGGQLAGPEKTTSPFDRQPARKFCDTCHTMPAATAYSMERKSRQQNIFGVAVGFCLFWPSLSIEAIMRKASGRSRTNTRICNYRPPGRSCILEPKKSVSEARGSRA